MAGRLMTPDPPVLYHNITRTEKGILHRYYPFLQPCRRGDDLEGGTGFIGIINTAIPPDSIQDLPLFFL